MGEEKVSAIGDFGKEIVLVGVKFRDRDVRD